MNVGVVGRDVGRGRGQAGGDRDTANPSSVLLFAATQCRTSSRPPNLEAWIWLPSLPLPARFSDALRREDLIRGWASVSYPNVDSPFPSL